MGKFKVKLTTVLKIADYQSCYLFLLAFAKVNLIKCMKKKLQSYLESQFLESTVKPQLSETSAGKVKPQLKV